jgi:prepilin-type N-terminal cleavage/methylation domain-containing protein
MKKQAGFTLIELVVTVSILAVLAGVVLMNLGTFFGSSKTEIMAVAAEQHQVASAVTAYLVYDPKVNTIGKAFWVGPDKPVEHDMPAYGKGVLGPFLIGSLQYVWAIGTDGSVTLDISRGVSPGIKYLFSSDLSSLAGFTSLMGNWSASGGILSPSTVPYQNRIVADGGPWTDFTFDTTATLVSGSGYGLYYRCDSNPKISGYIFQFDPGLGNKFVVRKVTGGNESSPFQTVSMPAGFQVNGQHSISVSVQGDRQVIKVDGVTVMDFRDSTYSSGTVGLRSWGYSNVKFTGFNVTPQ